MSQRRRADEALRRRMLNSAARKLILNLIYGAYHIFLGMPTMGTYYVILGMARIASVLSARRNADSVAQVCGGLLILLGAALAGANAWSMHLGRAEGHGMIVMITIAAYTFYKIGREGHRAVRQRRNPSPLLATLRSIGYAEVAGSLLTMQREMLVSFGGMEPDKALWMNALTGAGVCLFVVGLGFTLIWKGSRKWKTRL